MALLQQTLLASLLHADEKMSDIIQMSVGNAYKRFLNVVLNMTPEQVDKIAQGRVWIATQAKELGLVDKLGDKQDVQQLSLLSLIIMMKPSSSRYTTRANATFFGSGC